MKRVAITGYGAISACGPSAADLWSSSVEGRSAVTEVKFERLKRQAVRQAAKLSDDFVASLTGYQPRFQDPVAAIAVAAADEAVKQAKLTEEDFGPRCGVIIGSGVGGATTIDTNYFRFMGAADVRLDPMSVPKTMANSPACWIAMRWKITGPSYCISTACSSANQSIGLGVQLIRAGIIDRCLVGGAEALLVNGMFAAWESLHVMSSTLCRPFSAQRNGIVLGEGAGVIVLESLDAAARRGAEVLAEVAGYGTTTDAVDLLRPDKDGVRNCMQLAVADAEIPLADIGYVNAHGTGTIANDINEAQALRDLFGSNFDDLRISSTKPIHGHALGATGALECIISICALQAQIAPPTINFAAVDPKIAFEPVPNVAMRFSAPAVMSNTFAFGGINATLVLVRAGHRA